jgi:OmpA-OmpF porin, OOP family
MNRRFAATAFAVMLAIGLAQPTPAAAQFGKLKDKIKQKVDDKVNKKVDCVLGEVFRDGKCVKESAGGAPEAAEATKAAGGTATAAESKKTGTLKPGQGAWANYDFVPGERVLFYEDFTRDRVGNFPKRLELVNGNGEVVEWPAGSGERWLQFTAGDNNEGFYVNLPEALPQRFTLEMELTIPWNGLRIYPSRTLNPAYYEEAYFWFSGSEVGVARGKNAGESTVDPRSLFINENYTGPCERGANDCGNISRPFKIRIAVDGKYAKVYLDEKRVANVPNLEMRRTNRLVFQFQATGINGTQYPPLMRNISINAGGKEMYDALMADGRLAIQGIYFDTGSDKIRPESSGTLSEIAEMMKEHSDLKLVIEGHTDNVGDAAANQTLSQKRAAAVVAALSAAPYSVEADRFKSIGFGASKPAKPNDTPEGRQANRRVELVVQK